MATTQIPDAASGKSRLDELFPDREYPALHFQVEATEKAARASLLDLPHATVKTPIFMPVGTQGTIKGMTTEQVDALDCHIILANTYHLGLRPGPDLLAEMQGLHKFENWNGNLLTDSGGFQMVSLLALAEFSEEGVNFQSPHDGSQMLLTPELSMHIQNQIGADIMMALDDVVSSKVSGPRVKEACERTLRWIDRCTAAHKRPNEQNLFGIVQGGLDPELRKLCLEGLISRDLPGYAIGGLSGGESKDAFWRMVHLCAQRLPANKPRYVMGVGYPVDMVVCVALGCDMFDCVYPTRTGRFGTALVRGGLLNLRGRECLTDFSPIDKDCPCTACRDYTRSYLHTLITSRQQTGSILISLHNIAHQLRLMKDVRQAISEGKFHQFVLDFMRLHYPTPDKYPKWVVEALEAAGFPLPDALPV